MDKQQKSLTDPLAILPRFAFYITVAADAASEGGRKVSHCSSSSSSSSINNQNQHRELSRVTINNNVKTDRDSQVIL